MASNMVELDNIFLLDAPINLGNDENFKKAKREIVDVIKINNLSLSMSALLFKTIMRELGNTPINEL